jgi:hypothetical protein
MTYAMPSLVRVAAYGFMMILAALLFGLGLLISTSGDSEDVPLLVSPVCHQKMTALTTVLQVQATLISKSGEFGEEDFQFVLGGQPPLLVTCQSPEGGLSFEDLVTKPTWSEGYGYMP